MRRLADYKPLYALDRTSLKGGFAEVFLATRKSDGTRVALKRPRRVPQAAERLQREIEVQSSLAHPNIMPIWEADPDKRWFVMPPAIGNLEDMRNQVDEEEFASLLMSAADALDIAHQRGYVHRDLTPPNILALPHSQGQRWVVADWGLVSRPYSSGSIPLTKAGTALGTDGFAAPEVLADGRNATPAADVFSLGRIAEWYLTGKVPRVGARTLPDGDKMHWRSFVRACTEAEAGRRAADMTSFRSLLDEVFTFVPAPPSARAHSMVTGILLGQHVAVSELFRLAADYPEDSEAYLDELARLPPNILQNWVRLDPPGAATAACQMCDHLTQDASWKDRDAEYAGTPLSFVHQILLELAAQDALGPVEDVAQDFFRAEMKCSQPSQRTRVREWLADLDGGSATVIARVIARNPAIGEYYRPLTTRHAALASVLAGRPTVPPP
jgi:eukaryotic-like serine/threonine-protein kinase